MSNGPLIFFPITRVLSWRQWSVLSFSPVTRNRKRKKRQRRSEITILENVKLIEAIISVWKSLTLFSSSMVAIGLGSYWFLYLKYLKKHGSQGFLGWFTENMNFREKLNFELIQTFVIFPETNCHKNFNSLKLWGNLRLDKTWHHLLYWEKVKRTNFINSFRKVFFT